MKTVIEIILTLCKFLEKFFSLLNPSQTQISSLASGKTEGEDGEIEPDEVDE